MAFISTDRVLRESTADRLSQLEKFSAYESIEELSSYLQLTNKELTSEFVRAIQKRAREKFFDAKHQSGLISDEQVVAKIKDKFSDKFSPPIEEAGLVSLFATGAETESWESASADGVWIGGARFDKIEGKSDFYWVTPITFVELFRKKYAVPLEFLAQPKPAIEKLRVIAFNVLWKANVRSDARFHRLEIVDLRFEKQTFDFPTSKQLENYGLQKKEEA